MGEVRLEAAAEGKGAQWKGGVRQQEEEVRCLVGRRRCFAGSVGASSTGEFHGRSSPFSVNTARW